MTQNKKMHFARAFDHDISNCYFMYMHCSDSDLDIDLGSNNLHQPKKYI